MTVTLQPFEFQYGDDGILMNGDLSLGDMLIDVKKVDGLDQAAYKVHSKSFDGTDGGLVKIEGREMRSIVISGDIIGGTEPIEPYLDDLKANFAPRNENIPLYLRAPGIDTRQVFCKSLGFKYSWEMSRRLNCTPFSVSFIADDPVVYGAVERTASIRTAPPVPGHGFNHSFDYSFGGEGISGGSLVVNEGNLDVGFILTVTGYSSTDLTISSLTKEKYVSLDLVTGSSDVLIVDFYNQNVSLNGVGRRNAVINEGWFKLAPGENQLLMFESGSGTVIATISYYDGFE